jgi:hypothetical protein
MTGSDKQQKTSKLSEVQLPLKGFHTVTKHRASGREMWVEGMGEARYRIKLLKRQPDTK